MQPVCGTNFWHMALSPERKDYETPYRHRGSQASSSVTQFSLAKSHGGPVHIPHLEHRVLHLTDQDHPEAGLQSGDVVKFVQQGQLCCVKEAHLDELTGEHAAQYVLDLAEHRSPAGKAPAQGGKGDAAEGPEQELDRHCLLEVVRQDAFLGFRAPAASWRYMQPRRKAPHRLVFFNLNLGIWEQWEVASGDPWSQPWTSMHLVLRSRRLPNITLDLQVHRVGRYGASPIAHAPPSRGLAAGGSDAADHISNSSASPPRTTGSRRSTAGSPATAAAGVAGGGVRKMLQFANELGEDEHLRRISSMLVQEWVRFVDVEKALRAEVEEQVVALVEEMAQLKMDTIGQVEFLRSEMNTEIIGLFDLAQLREFQLQQAHAIRRRVLAVVVAGQWRRKAYHVMQLVMEGWLKVGTRKTRLAQARHRADRRMLGRGFGAWEACAAARSARARLLIRGVMATSRRVMQRAMEGWRDLTHCRNLGRQQLLALANRADAALVADAFEGWQLACIPHAPLWGQAVRVHARTGQRRLAGMLLGWRDVGRGLQALRAMGTKCARRSKDRFMRAALHKWGEVVEEGHRLRAVGAAVQERSHARLCYATIAAWRQRTQRNTVVARKLNAHLAKRQRACQAEAMEGWWGLLCDARAAKAKLRRAQHRRSARLQRGAWDSWVEAAAHKASQRRRVACRRQALSRRVLSAAMSALWEQVRIARAGRRVVHKWTRGTLLQTFQAWAGVCVRSAQGTALLQSVARARSSSMLAFALREWAWIARWHTAMRSHALDLLPEDTKSVMVLALGAWWLPIAAPDTEEGRYPASPAPSAMPASTIVPYGPYQASPVPIAVGEHGSSLRVQESMVAAPAAAAEHESGQSMAVLSDIGAQTPPAVHTSFAAHEHSSAAVGMSFFQQQQHSGTAGGMSFAPQQHSTAADVGLMTCNVEGHKMMFAIQGTPGDSVFGGSVGDSSGSSGVSSSSGANGRMTWLVCVALREWRSAAEEQRQLHSCIDRHRRKAEWRMLHAVLREWASAVCSAQGARAVAMRWAQDSLTGLICQVLLGWHFEAQDSKARTRALAQRVAYTTEAKLRAVLLSWCDVVASSALTREAAEARATELQQGLLRGVLSVWADFVEGRKALFALVVHAVKRMSTLRLRLALDTWVEAVLMQRARAADEGRACRWHAHRRLRVCLAALNNNVCDAHAMQATVCAMVVRTSAARVAAAMAVWVAQTRRAAVLRCRAQSVSRCRDMRLLAVAMFGWVKRTQDALAVRGKVCRMWSASDIRLQRAAFQEWATAAQSCALGRKLLVKWAAEYTQGMLGLVVKNWWEQTHAAAIRKEAAATVCKRRQQQLLTCMMTAWQRQSRAKAYAQELVVQALRRAAARNLRSCLLSWRSACEHRAWRLAMLEVGVQRRYSAVCGTVLSAWSAEVVKARLRQRGMARLQRRRDLGTLQVHLRTWQQVVADNRRRMEGLKACIKRKKVAFQLFKAWYWDAFDSDVQETIRRMFHTTSSVTPALPRPPLVRPISRIPMPTSISNPSLLGQQQQQQQTIAAAAAAASGAARRSVNGPPTAGPQVGLTGGHRGGDINVHALLRGSYRARYGGGEPDQAEHGHGSSSGVLMGAMPRRGWQASPGIGQRPSIYSTLPASQPPPRTSAPRPDPGTPTRAAWMMGAAEQGGILEGSAPLDHLPGDGTTLQGDVHSNGLSVAQQQQQQDSEGSRQQQQQTHWGSEMGLSSPELGSPVRKSPDVSSRQREGNGFLEQSFHLGRYNDLFSESEGEDDVPLSFAK